MSSIINQYHQLLHEKGIDVRMDNPVFVRINKRFTQKNKDVLVSHDESEKELVSLKLYHSIKIIINEEIQNSNN